MFFSGVPLAEQENEQHGRNILHVDFHPVREYDMLEVIGVVNLSGQWYEPIKLLLAEHDVATVVSVAPGPAIPAATAVSLRLLRLLFLFLWYGGCDLGGELLQLLDCVNACLDGGLYISRGFNENALLAVGQQFPLKVKAASKWAKTVGGFVKQ